MGLNRQLFFQLFHFTKLHFFAFYPFHSNSIHSIFCSIVSVIFISIPFHYILFIPSYKSFNCVKKIQLCCNWTECCHTDLWFLLSFDWVKKHCCAVIGRNVATQICGSYWVLIGLKSTAVLWLDRVLSHRLGYFETPQKRTLFAQ